MNKLLWWFKRCLDVWDETIDLVRREEAKSCLVMDIPCELTEEEVLLGLTEYIASLKK